MMGLAGSRWGFLALATALLALALPLAAHGEDTGRDAVADPFVCARLVIAIDASTSTEQGAFERQIAALSGAMEAPRFAEAVQDCLPGTLGLAVLTWSGPGQQVLCQPWSAVTTAEDMRRISETLESCPRLGGSTDLGGALGAALGLLEGSPFESHYRIVYLFTNGRTDSGREPLLQTIRDEAEASGVTVAGHALLRRSRFWKAPRNSLDPFHRYVDLEVTTGPRSFTSASDVGEDQGEVLDALVRLLRQELQ